MHFADFAQFTGVPLPSLDHLTVSLSRISLYMIVQWLSKSSLLSLRHITMIFFYEDLSSQLTPDSEDPGEVPSFGWENVDAVLSKATFLRHVEIIGDYDESDDRCLREMRERKQMFFSSLPRVAAKGILTYQ